jgi:DNA end-binding protein Ku
VVEPDELDALDPVATRSIDLEDFVELAEIDPIFYDSPYYLAPDRGAAKPYALLARAMEDSGKVGIARFVMRSKQYLAAIRVSDGHLVLSTMVYADEVVDPAGVEGIEEAEDVELSERELAMARQLIESLAADFEPERYHDTHRQQVLELIERKAAGEEIALPTTAPEPAKVVDLMAALEASVREAKAARGRHPTGKAGEEPAAAEPEAAPAPKARKRKSA